MSLVDELGLGPRECVALVGAGGKSTILAGLAGDYAGSTSRVVLTTTTRMAPDQIGDPVVWSRDPHVIDRALVPGVPLFVATRREGHKVIGVAPGDVDRIYAETTADQVVVEADGARRMSIKAPADHEPAIPTQATLVVVVVGVDAVGRPAAAVAHRPELVVALTGSSTSQPLTVDDIVTVVLHERGGLKSVPDGARVVIAVTKVDAGSQAAASDLVSLVTAHPRIERALTLTRPG